MNFFIALRKEINHRIALFGDQMIPFGIFGLISFPLYYGFWVYLSLQYYENALLRTMVTGLCVPLVLKKQWPKFLMPWQGCYWYLSLLLSLPFFFTFMLLKNHFSNVWLMSTTLVMVWLMLLVDWASFVVLLLLGILMAWIAYEFTQPYPFAISPYFNHDLPLSLGLACQYFGALAVVLIFARNKEQINRIKLGTLRAISASMAHELRTPLRTIACILHRLQQGNLTDKETSNCLSSAQAETRSAFNLIDMLLIKADLSHITQASFVPCSMHKVIEQALKRYPFKPGELACIKYIPGEDFMFLGHQDLMIHVLFNLLKNALYYIKKNRTVSGNICIQCQAGSKSHRLLFQDNGPGIPASILPHIFDQFFTQTAHGTGIGLYFCQQVITQFGGSITCHSSTHQSTVFQIDLPQTGNQTC